MQIRTLTDTTHKLRNNSTQIFEVIYFENKLYQVV
jgi:hypothetical protein